MEEKLRKLREALAEMDSVAVAFSGGVDSSFLLAVAHNVLGERVVAVTAESCLVPQSELEAARLWCADNGVRQIVVPIDPFEVEGFGANPPDRCYLCKLNLFAKMREAAYEAGADALVDGSNVDDLRAYRPGRRALDELGILSPLVQAGFAKDEIRACSHDLGLAVWDKPSAACLASRFPYGEQLSRERLARVEAAEDMLHGEGLAQVRVRCHGDLARIEVPAEYISALVELLRTGMSERLHDLGFSFVTVDADGFRSGSFDAAAGLVDVGSKAKEAVYVGDALAPDAEEDWLVRTRLLLGASGIQALRQARVCVFGVGGVGGYAVEALARAGVGALDLVDNDVVSASNLNRQIIATRATIGRPKVDVAAERIASINPSCAVNRHRCFYLPETRGQFDFGAYDYVIDAVDTVSAKLDIVEAATLAGTPVISCMGTGNKLDPTQLEVSDISQTSVCGLAKVMRKELRKRGITSLKVVYSREPALGAAAGEAPELKASGRPVPGSVSFVPGAAGLIAAGEAIKDIVAAIQAR